MDIRRREAELFLLRYDGEETEAIKHLRYVSEQLDEAMEDVEAWEMNDANVADELDGMRSRLESAEAREAAMESKVAALKNAAKELLNSALAEGEANGTLGISAAALIKYREAMK